MIYIGIDVAKDKHDCHIITADGEILCDNFTFENSMKGFCEFRHLVEGLCSDVASVTVGLEYTGHYSVSIMAYLKNCRYNVLAFNPLSVNRYRKAKSLRSTKTDRTDARYIAEMALNGEAEQTAVSVAGGGACREAENIATLKSLSRYRYRLLKVVQPVKNRYRRVLQIVFPEFEHVFNVNYKATLQLLCRYPSPGHVCRENTEVLAAVLKEVSHGHYVKKAGDFVAAAKCSVGAANEGDVFELRQVARQLLFLMNELDVAESRIAELMRELNSPILTVPGIGVITGAAILGEIGNINNFSNADKLLAFVGGEPSIYQSGKFFGTNTPMVKKGSKYLRNAMFQAAKSAYITDDYMRAYLDKKRDTGKHFNVALSHGMKKLTRIVYAVLKSGIPYHSPMAQSACAAEIKQAV